MKAIFIGLSGRSYPYVRVRCYDFAAELKRHGVETSVISFRDHLSGGLSELEMWDRGDRAKLGMSVKALLRLVREKPQLLYIQKIHYHAAAPYLLARLRGMPYVLDYDDWDEGIECLFKRPWLNKTVFGHARYSDILKAVAGNASACVVSSRYLLERLSGLTRNIALIPTGVDTTVFTPRGKRNDDGKVVFGWTGVVWGELMLRNMLFMLECFRRVASVVPGAALRIVGGGQLMPRVRGVIAREYRDCDIEVEEWMPHGRMPEFLSRIDVGLLPLIQKGDPWIEAKSPTKFFEYMAMGLPTVASRVGELRSIIEDGQDGFLAETVGEFAEKMRLLAADRDARKRMGERARGTIVDRYSIEMLGRNLFQFLCRCNLLERGET